MKFAYRVLGAALTSALLLATPARAEPGEETGHLVFGLGYHDFDNGENDAADFRVDYRHGKGLYFIKPWLGIEATNDGAVWGGGGLYADLPIYQRLYLTVATGVGGYSQGDGKDLGHTVEFRSQAEASYRFDNGMRLGIAISHLSNASLSDKNPGVNVLSAVYLVPLGSLIPD